MEPIQVTRSSMPEFDEYVEEIRELWDSHWLTNMGTKHNKLKDELAKYLQVPNVMLFTNGHLALEGVLSTLQLKGEIITTPFTFASTTHAIVRSGLKPVFCDINPYTYTIDADQIEALITENTSAILPVHIYGNICDVEKIQNIADKHHLKVIYDAAHSFGTSLYGTGVGNFGDASMFSFHATKVFNTIEGGALAFKDAALSQLLYGYKNFGIRSQTSVDAVGINAKMNEFQAAMGICNLRHVEDEIRKRKKVFHHYMSQLSGTKGLQFMKLAEGVETNYSYFPVVFNEKTLGYDREFVYDSLAKENINARRYFYPLTSDFECYKNRFNSSETPVAQYISQRILTLPLYANLDLEDVDRICRIVLNH
ncbi:MAG TPA: DegT/DnrJ/EryC1/StrS family aminotransferase [Mobilitalea sp.]|nr:DegT/DnrJ/EryC1/StrS family aminotransferase [Mobilitalea sp.]